MGVAEDCSNLHQLPTLWISLSGRWLPMPPQYYVGRFQSLREAREVRSITASRSSASGRQAAFRAGRQLDSDQRVGGVCAALFMAEDTSTNLGPMAILGMPFLRAYAAVFNRTAKTIGFSQQAFGSNACAA